MPIREMLRYAVLRRQGVPSEAVRRQLLEAHRERVCKHVTELQSCLLVLDSKIAGYADAEQRGHEQTRAARRYSITSSALASSVGGMLSPNPLAAPRFMTSSNLVGCSTGRLAGDAPLRILST